MEMKKKMEKKLTNIGLAAILVIAVFVAVTGIASAEINTNYNENGKYIEGINVTVNTTANFNMSNCCTPLEFLINNTLNSSATSFNVTTPGLTTNVTAGDMVNDSWFWVNASIPGTYWVNVSNKDNQSEYVYFTVEYSSITITTYNENGKYIEGINVSVNTSDGFNMSDINVPLTFQINNTLNGSATNFSVANQSGLTTNATDSMKNDSWFWVNATEAGTYCINVFNKDNQSEYMHFTVEYSNITITTYNKDGKYIEGINVSVNTSKYFNRSYINVPLTFQINNTLNPTAANFSVDNQSGLTTNATGGDLAANEWFWVNASIPGTYWVNVSNNDNQSEYVNFTVEYSNITITIEKIEIKPETLNLGSKGVFTAFITLPEGCYDVADINVSTVECEGVGLADLKKRIDGDNRFIAKFKREEVVNALNTTGKVDVQTLNKTGNNVTLNVTWKLDDGTPFEGNDTIRVINRGKWGLGVLGNPLNEVKKWAKKVHKKFLPFDDDAIASSSDEVIVTVTETSTNTMHIINIDMSTDSRSAGPKNTFVWAVVAVTIVDDSDSQVGGATVSGHWSGATSDSDSGVTDAKGQVSLESNSVKKPSDGTTFTFTVGGVAKDSWTYNSSANVKTNGSITVP